MNKVFALALLLNSVTSFAETSIANFRVVNENLVRGGRPRPDQFDELKELGVETILNLESEVFETRPRAVRREEAWARGNEIEFIHQPLHPFRTPRVEDVLKAYSALINRGNKKVFIHCDRGSDRTGIVIAAYRILHDHWSVDDAYVEMTKIGHSARVFKGWRKVLEEIANKGKRYPSAISSSAVSFSSLLETNLDQHPDVRALEKEVESSEIKASESLWLGDTSLSVARTGAEVPLGSGPGAQTEFGITQSFAWPGKGRRLTRLAELDADRTKIDLEKKRRQIEKETALLYSQLMTSSLKSNIANQKLLTLHAAKKTTARNVRSGHGLSIDDNLIAREIELAELQLEQFSADKTQKITEIETKFPTVKMDGASRESALPRAYFQKRATHAENLSLRAFSFDVEKALTEASLKRQFVWPDFSLGLTRKNEKQYDVGVSFTIPLWYPLRQSKQISAAESVAQATDMRLKYQQQIAPLTESVLKIKIQQLRRQIEGRKKVVRSISEPTLKQSRNLFELGRIDWKQLQLAFSAVFEDQEKIADLDLDLFSAELDLYELLGVIE